MQTKEFRYSTAGRQVVDLTDDVTEFCGELGDALLSVFTPTRPWDSP